MTRIVLDGLPLFVRSAGVARYTLELARAIANAAPETEFSLFGPRYPQPRLGPEVLPPNLSITRSWRYPLAMKQPLPHLPKFVAAAAAAGPHDLFHGTTYTAPARPSTPVVLTIHDLALLRNPKWGTEALTKMVRSSIEQLTEARAIIAVSNATRHDLIELCGIPREQIYVVHNGVESCYHPGDSEQSRALIERWLGEEGPFVLHVGTLEPRKNVETLVTAFSEARRCTGAKHKLLLAGEKGWGIGDLEALVADLDHAPHTRVLGRVSDQHLQHLYRAADLFAYPSFYEGFGLPVLEAMASGTAVLASNRSALPEVIGDAGVLIDPDCEAELAAKLAELMTSPERRTELATAGQIRAKDFSWEKCAKETLAVYSQVLQRPL